MKTFSLLCPTRQRPHYLKAYLDSLKDKTLRADRIEVLIAYDDDDILTKEKIIDTKMLSTYPFKIRIFSRKRSKFINKSYYNCLTKLNTLRTT